MNQIKIEVCYKKTKVVNLLLEVSTTTDVGRLLWKAAEPKTGLVDYWVTMFLQARGPRSFPLSSGYSNYEDLLFVLDQFKDGWTYSVENPPPKGKPFVPEIPIIH